MTDESSDYDVGDSDLEEGPSAAVVHQSALPSATQSVIRPIQFEDSMDNPSYSDESLKEEDEEEEDKEAEVFKTENSGLSAGKDDVLSKALEILKESDPETKSAASKRKPASKGVNKSRSPIGVEEDPLTLKKLQKFSKIPVLNKDTANPNTYDIEYLLDPKIQNRTKSRLSKNNSSLNSQSQLKIHEVDHIEKNKKNAALARKRIDKHESSSNLDLIISPKGRKVNVEERFYQYKDKVNQKVKQLRSEYEKKELETCTFKPSVNPNQYKRTVDEFISSMEEYNKAKAEKIKNLKEMYEKEKGENKAPYKPSICKRSEELLNKKKVERSGPIHENLYKGYKKAFNKQLDGVTKDESHSLNASISDNESLNFVPKVNKRSKQIKRSESIDKILYEDALRRRNKSVDMTDSRIKLISDRSEKVLVKKFKEEFNETWKSLDPDGSNKLNYTKLSEILKQLAFIKKDSSQERMLLLKMWKIVGGEEKNYITKEDLYTFLQAILSFPTTSRPLDESMNSVSSQYGTFQDGAFYVNDTQGKKIHRTFELWYENRLSVTNKSYLNRSFKHNEDFSFHPQLNKSSSKLASDYRKKRSDSAGPHNQYIEYLINEKKKTLEKNEKLKREKEEQEYESCTFRPKTTSIPSTSRAGSTTRSNKRESLSEEYLKTVSDPSAKIHRTDVLYQFSKVAQDKKTKRIRNPEDVEIEKNKDECTFAPDIKASSKSVTNLSISASEAKGVSQLIERLRKARADNELVKIMTEPRSSLLGEAKPIVTGLEVAHKGQSTFDASKQIKSSSKSGITKSESAPYLNAFMKSIQKKKEELQSPSPKYNTSKRTSLLNTSSRSGSHQHSETPASQPKPNEHRYANIQNEEPDMSYSDSDSIVISVNLSPSVTDQIKVKPGDDVEKLVQIFVNKHGKVYTGLNDSMKEKLVSELNTALEAVGEESDAEV